MNFIKPDCYAEAAQMACRLYPWAEGKTVTLWHLSENATFLIKGKADRMPAGVMRVSRIGYHKETEIRAELQWLCRLKDQNQVRTVHPIPNDAGEWLTTAEAGGQTFVCVAFEYLPGKNPDPGQDAEAEADFYQVGRIAALLHQNTARWKESRKLDRPCWDYGNMLGSEGLFGDWRKCRDFNSREYDIMERTCRVIGERLFKYGKEEERYGLIHADLRAANLLKERDRIQVIDFDDCGFGWYLYDLAASFSFYEEDERLNRWIREWVKGYGTVRTLKKEDIREIPVFLMARRIQLLAWLTSHEDSDPVRDLYPGFARGTVELAVKFNEFYKNI